MIHIKNLNTTNFMKPGNSVMHSTFGYGTISDIQGEIATVNFDNVGKQTVNVNTLNQLINS